MLVSSRSDDHADGPADRVQHRHVHVVQNEDLVAEHGQSVEIVLSLLEFQPRTDAWRVATCFERDRDTVTELAGQRVASTRSSQVRSRMLPSPRVWRTAGPNWLRAAPQPSASARANSASGTACSKVSMTTSTTSLGSCV